MDAADLARWTRFATKGGIGRCQATSDCVAQGADDLMFLKVSFLRISRIQKALNLIVNCVGVQDDEITVLMQLNDEGLFLVSFPA